MVSATRAPTASTRPARAPAVSKLHVFFFAVPSFAFLARLPAAVTRVCRPRRSCSRTFHCFYFVTDCRPLPLRLHRRRLQRLRRHQRGVHPRFSDTAASVPLAFCCRTALCYSRPSDLSCSSLRTCEGTSFIASQLTVVCSVAVRPAAGSVPRAGGVHQHCRLPLVRRLPQVCFILILFLHFVSVFVLSRCMVCWFCSPHLVLRAVLVSSCCPD